MGVMIFRPGQQPSFSGVQIWRPHATTGGSTWWDNNGAISGCVAAYQPKGASGLSNSYINKANPGTDNAAPGVAPTWDATGGWTFDGTTQYLLAASVLTSSYSMLIRFSNLTLGSSKCYAGSYHDSGENATFLIQQQSSTNLRFYSGSLTSELSIASTVTSGVVGLAGKTCYLDSTNLGTTNAGTFATSLVVAIGGLRYQNSSTIQFCEVKIQALAIYSTTLTAGEVATLTTLMNAL